jgi:putative Holliday junction resolvase
MGIDYGAKRIGVAVSDENGRLAFAKTILKNDKNIFQNLSKIIEEEGVKELVIGESLDSSGGENEIMEEINIFISQAKSLFKMPIHKQKEFFTSVEARRSRVVKKDLNFSQSHSKIKKVKTGRVDASAAALILQRYLDKINN